MASRILGMGDVLSLIEKAQANIDEEAARNLGSKIVKAEFDFNDYLESMRQMKKLGSISDILGMLPGIGNLTGGQMSQLTDAMDESRLKRLEAIIYSMTPAERADPKLLNPSRKRRLAAGAGVDISEVNRFIKQFDQSRKMMKRMPGMLGGGRKGKMGRMNFPFA